MINLSRPIAHGLATAALLSVVGTANAVPELQLSIAGGTYDTTSETSISSGPVFDLYAYLNRASNTGTFYVSMALTPAVAEAVPAPDFGSFTYDIGGGPVLVNVTGNMLYGVPPIDVGGVADADGGDLGPHDIFPTYFTEVAITFAATDLSVLYDVQNVDDGAPVTPAPGDSTMFFKKISLNLSNLTDNKQLHFDLYDEVFRTQNCNPNDIACDPTLITDIDAGINAPFSHDAQSGSSSSSGGSGGASGEVPEPGTLSLIGAALALGGLSWLRRRSVRA